MTRSPTPSREPAQVRQPPGGMRFRTLSLIRYGHFTDREIDLSGDRHDLHIIHGPNEAGKSTCQSAVGDLLFGIPHLTEYNFRHDNRDLRIGAALEHDGALHRIIRRKGNRHTLLDADGNAMADHLLRSLLDGTDRSFFERMFSLNHRRLEAGGQEILAAEGQVGQTLFAAGAGLAGLQRIVRRLDQEAEALWAPRHAKRRAYHAAEDELKEARRRLRETSVTAGHWRTLSREVETRRAARERARDALAASNRHKARLERIRRVLPHLTELHQHQRELAELGPVSELPSDAAQRLRQAEDARIQAQTRCDDLQRQLEEARGRVAAIVPDQDILELDDAIDALVQECALVEETRRALPRQQAELESAQREMERSARDLSWQDSAVEAVVSRLPARVERERLRGRIEAWESARRDRDQARARQVELEQEVDAIVTELGTLAATDGGDGLALLLRDARRLGNVDEQIAEMRSRWERLGPELAEGMAGLSGWSGTLEQLAALAVPSRQQIEGHRVEHEALASRLEQLRRQRMTDEERLAELQLEREQTVRDQQAVSRDVLEAARQARDGQWDRIRARWLSPPAESGDASDDETLADDFGQAVAQADRLADRRFENATAVAALTRIDREIERTRVAIAQRERREQEAATDREGWNAEWQACWRESGIEPAAPDVMLDWLERRCRLLERRQERAELERQIASLEKRCAAHRKRLAEALSPANGPEIATTGSFAAMIDHASDLLDRMRQADARRQQLETQREKVAGRLATACERARETDAACRDRRQAAADGLTACGLSPDLDPEAARTALRIQQELAAQAETVGRLSGEIGRARDDVIDRFAQRVARIRNTLNEAASEEDPLTAVRRLGKRLAQARHARLRQRDEVQRVEDLAAELEGAREAAAQAEAQIAHLCMLADTEEVSGLNDAIRRGQRARALEEAIRAATRAALQAGDGQPLAALRSEARDMEADQIAADVARLDEDIADRTRDLSELSARLQEAESELRRLDGAETAALAEGRRQQALADMGEAVRQYARTRGAAMLLRWSLDRYRREHQGPLLARAGELFRTLTLGSFERLEVDFDTRDRLELAGVRPDGERVRVNGMSDGTTDQLYLALRTAAIEAYLDKAPALPFVVDDLFINFDDARAAAGLELLAALSRRTQVLFFTHHDHLVELAQQTLGARAHVVTL